MSIFDPDFPYNPLPWLQEKTLTALEAAAELVDLANEPDTAAWYATALRERAERIVARLAPVVALLHGAGAEAAHHEEWRGIVEGGSLALARWCKKWEVADPRRMAMAALARQADPEEGTAKEETGPQRDPVPADDASGLELSLRLCGLMCSRLLDRDMPEGSARLLLWLLANLNGSDRADAVLISKRFLPNDIDLSPEETAEAYRDLYERVFVERVDGVDGNRPDALALRLVVEGLNESKSPAPFREESFGYPGCRVGGKRTFPHELRIRLKGSTAEAVSRWVVREADGASLREALQAAVGPSVTHIDEATVENHPDGVVLCVRLHLPVEAKGAGDQDLEDALRRATEAWTKSRVMGESLTD